MVNIRDVARAAGVSATTVSRFLNHDASLSIREETKEHIIQTCKLMDYTQRDYKGKKKVLSIGIITAATHDEETENPYFQTLRRSVVSLAKKHHFGISFMVAAANLLSIWPSLSQTNVVIVIGHIDRAMLKAIHHVNPNTIVTEDFYCGEAFHSVSVDFHHEACQLLAKLAALGHADIAYIGGENTRSGLNGIDFKDGIGDRETAFIEWCQDQHVDLQKRCFVGYAWDSATGYMQTQRLLSQKGPLPSCILVASDTMAIGVLECLKENHLTVPNDISICSFNNIQLSALTTPSLTTFHIDIPQTANWVIVLCQKIIQKSFSPPIRITLSGDLIMRDSLRLLSSSSQLTRLIN